MTKQEKMIKSKQRCLHVYRLRGFGLTFVDIAKELNVSYGRARDIYKRGERIVNRIKRQVEYGN